MVSLVPNWIEIWSDIQEVVFEVSRSNCPMGTSRGSDVRESYFFHCGEGVCSNQC